MVAQLRCGLLSRFAGLVKTLLRALLTAKWLQVFAISQSTAATPLMFLRLAVARSMTRERF